MAQQIVDRRDQDFLLHEVMNVEALSKTEKFADFNKKTVDMIVTEARSLAVNELLPANKAEGAEGQTLTCDYWNSLDPTELLRAEVGYQESKVLLCGVRFLCKRNGVNLKKLHKNSKKMTGGENRVRQVDPIQLISFPGMFQTAIFFDFFATPKKAHTILAAHLALSLLP